MSYGLTSLYQQNDWIDDLATQNLGSVTMPDYNLGDAISIAQQSEQYRGATSMLVEKAKGSIGEMKPASHWVKELGINPYTEQPYINPDGRDLTEAQANEIKKRHDATGRYNQMKQYGGGNVATDILGGIATPDMLVEGVAFAVLSTATTATFGATAPALTALTAYKIAKNAKKISSLSKIAKETAKHASKISKAKKLASKAKQAQSLSTKAKIIQSAKIGAITGGAEGGVVGVGKAYFASQDDQGRDNSYFEGLIEAVAGAGLGGLFGGAGRSFSAIKEAKIEKKARLAERQIEIDITNRKRHLSNILTEEGKIAMIMDIETKINKGSTTPSPSKHLIDLERHRYKSEANQKKIQSEYDLQRYTENAPPIDNAMERIMKATGKKSHEDFTNKEWSDFYTKDKINQEFLQSEELARLRGKITELVAEVKKEKGSPKTENKISAEIKLQDLLERYKYDLREEEITRMLAGDNALLEKAMTLSKMDSNLKSLDTIMDDFTASKEALEVGEKWVDDPEVAHFLKTQKEEMDNVVKRYKSKKEDISDVFGEEDISDVFKEENGKTETKNSKSKKKDRYTEEVSKITENAKNKFSKDAETLKAIKGVEKKTLSRIKKIRQKDKIIKDYINCRRG